jgi:hypothetical protein
MLLAVVGAVSVNTIRNGHGMVKKQYRCSMGAEYGFSLPSCAETPVALLDGQGV